MFFALSAPLAKAKVTLISAIPSNGVNVNIRQLPAAGCEVTQIKRDKMNNKSFPFPFGFPALYICVFWRNMTCQKLSRYNGQSLARTASCSILGIKTNDFIVFFKNICYGIYYVLK